MSLSKKDMERLRRLGVTVSPELPDAGALITQLEAKLADQTASREMVAALKQISAQQAAMAEALKTLKTTIVERPQDNLAERIVIEQPTRDYEFTIHRGRDDLIESISATVRRTLQ